MLYIPGKPQVKEPKDQFIKLIEGDFGLGLTDRISIIADVNHFKFMEDESVWEQARGRRSNYYEVYWDGVWISDFTDDDKLDVVRLNFLKGFKKAYEEGRVSLNTQEELKDRIVEDAAQKAIEEVKNMKVESKEDHIMKETLTQLHEDNKKKKKKKLSDFN